MYVLVARHTYTHYPRSAEDEVDAFLATVDDATPDEVRNVVFNVRRRGLAYAEDPVDQLLDLIWADKIRSATERGE